MTAFPSTRICPILQRKLYINHTQIRARRRPTALETCNRVCANRTSYILDEDIFQLEFRAVAIACCAGESGTLRNSER
jgi:hypothetical protein